MKFRIKDKEIFISANIIKLVVVLFFICFCYKVALQVVSGQIVKNLILLVALAVFLYVLKCPRIIFYSFIFFLPFTEVFQLMRADFLCLPNLIGLLVLFFILVKMASGEDLKIYKTPLDWPIFILLIVFIFSLLQSRFIPVNYEVLEATRFNRPFNRSFFQIIAIVYLIILYYMTNSLINKKEDLAKVIKVWIISSVVVALLGIYGFVGYQLGLPFTSKLVDVTMIVPRVCSVLREPMFLGLYFMTVIPLIFSLIIGKSSLFAKKWLIVFFVLLIAVLALSTARGAWIALVISLVVTMFFYSRNKVAVLKWIFAILLFMGVIFSILNIMFKKAGVERYLLWRFYNISEDFSTLNRLDTIITGFNMFKAHSVLGVGYGNYPFHFLDYAPDFHYRLFTWIPGGNFIFPNAHNIFANYLAETGILGTLALSWFLFLILAITFKAINKTADGFYKPILIGYFSSFLAVLIVYQFFSTINITFLWVLIAVIVSLQRLATRGEE